MRYLLTSGETTTDYDAYIIDLLTFVLTVPKGIIMNKRNIGFTKVTSTGLYGNVQQENETLIQNAINGLGIADIKFVSLTLEPFVIKIEYKGKEYDIK